LWNVLKSRVQIQKICVDDCAKILHQVAGLYECNDCHFAYAAEIVDSPQGSLSSPQVASVFTPPPPSLAKTFGDPVKLKSPHEMESPIRAMGMLFAKTFGDPVACAPS
jgi:hypothetical protein